MGYSMNVTNFVQTTYLLATGKVATLDSGSTKYLKILALGNVFTQTWAAEPDTDWNSLRASFSLGSVTATASYSLPLTQMSKISSEPGDFVRILHTDGVTESDYTLVPIGSLYDGGTSLNNYGEPQYNASGTCAVSAGSLVFSRAFKSTDPQFGGTITVPGYSIPATLVLPADLIKVDNPYWLCNMCAAEYVRNDITRVQQFGNLIAYATDLMESMKTANNPQSDTMYVSGWAPLGETWS